MAWWPNLLGLVAATILAPVVIGAQTPAAAAPPARAASVSTPVPPAITGADLRRHLGALAADSLCRPATPSRGLDATARYVAAVFERVGLRPDRYIGTDTATSLIEHYPIPGQQRVNTDAGKSYLYLLVDRRRNGRKIVNELGEVVEKIISLDLANVAYFASEVGPQTIASDPNYLFSGKSLASQSLPVAIVAGRQTVAAVQAAAATLDGKVALYIPAADVDSAGRRRIVAALYLASRGVVIVSASDSTRFNVEHLARQQLAGFVDYSMRETGIAAERHRRPWALSVWARPIHAFLGAAGADLPALQADTTPVIRPLPATGIALVAVGRLIAEPIIAPLVAGRLEDRDPTARRGDVLLSAHMDNLGCDAGGTDSVRGDASGLAALLAVAEALNRSSVPLRRSVVFLATSGGGRESWGTNFYAERKMWFRGRGAPGIHITLGRLGWPVSDSLTIDGLSEVELALSPYWVASAYPDLRLIPRDGGSMAEGRSGDAAFARRAVPSLYVHVGDPESSNAPLPLDAEQVARVSRFVAYLVQGIATADHQPQWTAEGRQRLGGTVVP